MKQIDVITENIDPKIMYKVIDTFVPFPLILKKAGVYGVAYSSIYCPFHDDHNHKSAKLFKDDDGDKIFCFAEHKMYRPSDVFKKEMLSEDPRIIYANIVKQLTPEQLEQVLQGATSTQIIPEAWTANIDQINKFRSHSISYKDLLALLIKE